MTVFPSILILLAQTTQPTWDEGIVHIIREVITALGGTAGIIAIVIAVVNRGRIGAVESTATAAAQSTQNIATRTEQIAGKVNEVADKNKADVAPLPPPSAPLVVHSPTTGAPLNLSNGDVNETKPNPIRIDVPPAGGGVRT